MNRTNSKIHTKVVVLLGPTGVGKTGASIRVAQYLDTEIISADSMQIYRHMNIGTDKPSERQRATVKHRMINIVEPSEKFSSGRYVEEVTPIIENLHRRERIPLVVGGTGLYIKAMTRGLFDAPEADWSLREQLLTMEREEPGVLYERLKELDPEIVVRIMPTDIRRIVRGLEVCIKTKRPMSELQDKLTKPLPCDFVKIGLRRDRAELYRMIEERVDGMIKEGLVEEVERVMKMNPCHTALQAIGYKEVALYIKGEIGIEKAVQLVKRASKRYAKRQFTWFKNEKGIAWIDTTGMSDDEEIGRLVIKELKRKTVLSSWKI